MNDFYQNFAIRIGAAESKQQAFLEFLGSFTWEANPKQGTVDLGRNRIYQLNLLGSWSKITNTWRWYWVEETRHDVHSDALVLIDHLRTQAGTTLPKEFGEQIFPLESLHPEMLPMTILAMFDELHAIFELPYEDGMGYVALRGNHPPILPSKSLLRLHTVVQKITSQYQVKLEHFLPGCASYYGLEFISYGTSFQLKGTEGRLFVWANSEGYFERSELDVKAVNSR